MRHSQDNTDYLQARAIAELLEEHKGGDVVLLDLRGLSLWTDFFIIATVSSGAHNEGLKKHIREFARNNSIEILNRKGGKNTGGSFWDLIDAGNIVIHLMSREARAFYELEKLWGSAKPAAGDENTGSK